MVRKLLTQIRSPIHLKESLKLSKPFSPERIRSEVDRSTPLEEQADLAIERIQFARMKTRREATRCAAQDDELVVEMAQSLRRLYPACPVDEAVPPFPLFV